VAGMPGGGEPLRPGMARGRWAEGFAIALENTLYPRINCASRRVAGMFQAHGQMSRAAVKRGCKAWCTGFTHQRQTLGVRGSGGGTGSAALRRESGGGSSRDAGYMASRKR